MKIKFNAQPISNIKDIPRFILEGTDYTGNFGFQWNKFRETQIDTAKNNEASRTSTERFFAETNWHQEDLDGKSILEAGSGAGRFTDVILNHTKANLYSFDYSNAVEANYENHKHFSERLQIFKASIHEIPFQKQQFDKVIFFGLLQHIPHSKKSVFGPSKQLKFGGEIVVDFNPLKGFYGKINVKYVLRPFTKNMESIKLLSLIEKNVDWMISLSKFLHKIGLGILSRFITLADIYGTLLYQELSKEQLRQWCVLDTFDQYSPMYDNPQKISTVAKWMKEAGLKVTFNNFIKTGNSYTAVVKAKRV